MNTDSKLDLRHPENTKLLLKDETHQVLGCAFDVLNEIGHGFHEKVYENALVVEFKLRGISCEQQKRFPIIYKDVQVAEFVPDLIVFGSVIVDTKVIEKKRPRARPDDELSSHHKTPRWLDFEFQESAPRMGSHCFMIFIRVNPCPSVVENFFA